MKLLKLVFLVIWIQAFFEFKIICKFENSLVVDFRSKGMSTLGRAKDKWWILRGHLELFLCNFFSGVRRFDYWFLT